MDLRWNLGWDHTNVIKIDMINVSTYDDQEDRKKTHYPVSSVQARCDRATATEYLQSRTNLCNCGFVKSFPKM